MKEAEVHQKAIKELSRICMVSSEVPTAFGRADVVSPRVVWEVKRSVTSQTKAAEAVSQADRYNRILKKEKIGLVVPHAKDEIGGAISATLFEAYPNLLVFDPFALTIHRFAEGGWAVIHDDGTTRWRPRSRLLHKIDAVVEALSSRDWGRLYSAAASLPQEEISKCFEFTKWRFDPQFLPEVAVEKLTAHLDALREELSEFDRQHASETDLSLLL
jgi:hypothetical protein